MYQAARWPSLFAQLTAVHTGLLAALSCVLPAFSSSPCAYTCNSHLFQVLAQQSPARGKHLDKCSHPPVQPWSLFALFSGAGVEWSQ